MVTESINPATAAIDSMSTRDIVAAIAAEDATVAPAVAAVGDAIARLVDIVVERMRRGGRLIYVGAGTSGRVGVLDAAECPPTFSAQPGQVVGLIAGGATALTQSVEEVEDNPAAGAHDIAGLAVGPGDVVLGIAASGRTPYVLGAVAEARNRGAFAAGLACTHLSPLAESVELMIAPIVGPEVIAGSTRLKAGTAQKLALNAFSTALMVRRGRTYGNLMSSMRVANAKLRERAVRICCLAASCDEDAARAALAAADDELEVALVMLLAGVDAGAARARLAAAGSVREAAR
jgi:N-acetylmuramic acid 6-phosphate etherase